MDRDKLGTSSRRRRTLGNQRFDRLIRFEIGDIDIETEGLSDLNPARGLSVSARYSMLHELSR